MSQPREWEGSNILTRRELFRRLSAISAATIVAGPLTGCKELWKRQPTIPVEAWHKAVCRFCGTGCGIQVGTRQGRVVDVKGDEYAHNKGRLCIKGILNRDILYVRDRLLHPMVRRAAELQRATPFHSARRLINRLTNVVYDPSSRQPEYKLCAVRVEARKL